MVEAMEIPKGFKKTEVGIIPNDWEVKTLGDVGEVKMCRRVFNHETSSEGTIPFYKIGTFGKESDAYISEELYNSYRQRFSFPKKGDILISAAGTIGRTLAYDGKPSYFQDSNIVWIDNKETLISNNYLYHVFQVVKYNTEGGTIQRLYNSILKSTKFLCPPTKAEQTAIATALNDADALITQLEKLIAKKRAIKQGAMQALLKPKAGWEIKKLGEVLKVRHGKSQKVVASDNGTYPILASGGVIGRAKVFLYDKPSVLIGRKGTIDKPQYMHTPFWSVDTLFFTEILDGYDAKFIFYMFNLIDWYSYNEASGVPSLNAKTIESIEKYFPKSEEQTSIAQILSDMDAEMEALEEKLDKYKMLKLGMMQTLLTGRIRLI
jgi:type I restriction enzyme, S subunit